MKIAIGTDHRGFTLKEAIIKQLTFAGHAVQWIDVGCSSLERCDYPLYTEPVTELVQKKKVEFGVLLCGSGIGMSIAANRFADVYAALVWNVQVAQLAREHNHANILVIPADFVDEALSFKMIEAWLHAIPQEGRYAERINYINSWGGI